jgi:carbonic anhydrase
VIIGAIATIARGIDLHHSQARLRVPSWKDRGDAASDKPANRGLIMDIIYRYDPYSKISPRQAKDPEAAIRELEAGHRRFRTIVANVEKELLGGSTPQPVVIPSNPLSLGFAAVGAPVQAPFALFLGCSDARAPIERIFDQPSNGLFVVRVAGNVLGTECLGSIDYAVNNLKATLKLLVVLGHTGCGAVTAAVDSYLSPHEYADMDFSHALRSLVDRIQIAVRGAAKAIDRVYGGAVKQAAGYRAALIEVAIYLNAALTAFDVRKEIRGIDGSSVRVVYGVLDLADQRVHGMPHQGGGEEATFGNVPDDAQGFSELGDQIARAVRARDAS